MLRLGISYVGNTDGPPRGAVLRQQALLIMTTDLTKKVRIKAHSFHKAAPATLFFGGRMLEGCWKARLGV